MRRSSQKGKQSDEVEWFQAPKVVEKLCFMILFASNGDADISGVSIEGDMYITEPMQLENGEFVGFTFATFL